MDAPLSQGRVLFGKYRVERVIGRGAMGVVLAARHIQLDDRVAIKLLLPEMLSEPGIQERFLQEAKAARRIKSEHVAHVSDVGMLELGTPYIIMEYLEGKDLAKIRGERGALEVEEVVDYVLQACDAIAEAHSHGIIHRDLKPANLFLTRRPDGSPLVKVLDFGTSKVAPKEADAGFEMTQTGMAIGSPSYMAPEQMLSSRHLDARADIWALGVILYNLLTGSFPFKAETLLQMCAAVIQSSPTPPSQYREDLPPGLEAAILKCLEKKPENRFSDVAGLARALLPFATGQTRYLVERIERVLGVSSDLATFLAPSTRNPLPERIHVDVPLALMPAQLPARTDGQPEGVASKSLMSSSLASVVRTGGSTGFGKSLVDAPAARRGKKTFLVGAGATLSLCAGLFFMVASPFKSGGAATAHGAEVPAQAASNKGDVPGVAVRPVETAAQVGLPTSVPNVEPNPTAAPGATVATPEPSSAATQVAAAPSATAATPGAPLTNADGSKKIQGRESVAALAAQPAQPTAPTPVYVRPAPPPSSAREKDSAVAIPDDR